MAHAARRTANVARAAARTAHQHEHDYAALLEGVSQSFRAASAAPRLFQTDAYGLWEYYLDSLPAERQLHDCHACRDFFRRYGALAHVDAATGELSSAMWDAPGVPEFYRGTFAHLAARVRRARITSVHYSREATWGTPITGAWSHVAVAPPARHVYREGALTAGQAMAASRENHRVVSEALRDRDFRASVLDQVLRLLDADALSRSERFSAPVRWLRALHDRPRARRGDNLLWLAVASAPEGFCHPRASVLAPLVADVAAGLPAADIQTKFAAMLHPLRYQRPQAAPAAGTIAAAEALVGRLGIARSLERRFARLDEVVSSWRHREPEPATSAGGVFGHLRPRGDHPVPQVDLPTTTMTWVKFFDTVLPDAERVELHAPARGHYVAYLTAEHADAPVINKWDNPVSAYSYHGGSDASQWGIAPGWVPVLAVSPLPHLWPAPPQEHLGVGALLVLAGAEDRRTGQGNALFPENLRPDLHGARAVVEAYSRTAEIGRPPGQLACGYCIYKSSTAGLVLRAYRGGGWQQVRIDRWD